jgi:nicotinamide-nucleotide amidase
MEFMTNKTIQLAQLLGQNLQQNNWQVTCAESCTGGGIGYAITSISGSSSWFKSGFITYANEAKRQLLGVLPATLKTYGAVSAQTVQEMAQGAAAKAGAQFGIAVSGIAGPDGGSAQKPVGTVWFGFYATGQIYSEKQLFTGDRQQIRAAAVDYALQRGIEICRQSQNKVTP